MVADGGDSWRLHPLDVLGRRGKARESEKLKHFVSSAGWDGGGGVDQGLLLSAPVEGAATVALSSWWYLPVGTTKQKGSSASWLAYSPSTPYFERLRVASEEGQRAGEGKVGSGGPGLCRGRAIEVQVQVQAGGDCCSASRIAGE
jgi:hypothetical protein